MAWCRTRASSTATTRPGWRHGRRPSTWPSTTCWPGSRMTRPRSQSSTRRTAPSSDASICGVSSTERYPTCSSRACAATSRCWSRTTGTRCSSRPTTRGSTWRRVTANCLSLPSAGVPGPGAWIVKSAGVAGGVFRRRECPKRAAPFVPAAMQDFQDRIRKYEEVYETIAQDNLHYVKLIDMVTGRGQMVLNRISGYIPGKIVFFLMQICKYGLAKPRKIWLTRHGESLYNQLGRIGGDSEISPLGRKYASRLADVMMDRIPLTLDGKALPVSVWTSTLKRTIQTAETMPFPKLRWKALDEIQAGAMEGMTYEEIERQMPAEFAARKVDKLSYRYPRGESYLDLIQRLEPVVTEVERERECVCIVGHQAVLRVLYGYLMNVPQEDIPTLSIPLHTLIELTPKPDGTMYEERFFIDIHAEDEPDKIAGIPKFVHSHSMHSRKNSQGGEPVSRTPPGRTEASSVGPGDDGVPLPEFPPKGAVSDAIAIPPQRDVVPGPETNVGSRELIERLAMMELAAKEAKERRATAGATSFPDLGLLGTHDAASTPGSTAPRSAGQSALLQSLPPRHAKSNMDLSQLLPENMPDANKDVISPYELSMMRQSQAQSQQGFSFAGPIHHGNMPQEGDPGHAKHPGNYTPNQGPSPTISASSSYLELVQRQKPTHAMFYGRPAEDEPSET